MLCRLDLPPRGGFKPGRLLVVDVVHLRYRIAARNDD